MNQGTGILVTGGCGSIGSNVVKYALAEHSFDRVYVFDNSEHSVFNLKREISEYADRTRFVLGDIRESNKLDNVMGDVDIVVHTAGVKHVPLSEHHPYEAVKTNIDGTHQVIEAAKANDVDQVLGVSTDKAVKPTSTMGATKMIAERLLMAAARYAPQDGPAFGCVRFGNLLKSNGSAYQTFREQISSGGPVTLTHRDMTRFILSVDRTPEFVFTTLQEMSQGEIHVPKMKAIRIVDVVSVMIDKYAPQDIPPSDIEIEITGLRPGERMHEYLITEPETRLVSERSDKYVVTPLAATSLQETNPPSKQVTPYCSRDASHLSKEEIRAFLGATEAELADL